MTPRRFTDADVAAGDALVAARIAIMTERPGVMFEQALWAVRRCHDCGWAIRAKVFIWRTYDRDTKEPVIQEHRVFCGACDRDRSAARHEHAARKLRRDAAALRAKRGAQ